MKTGYSDMVQTLSLEAESDGEKLFLQTLAGQIGRQNGIYVVDWNKEKGKLLLNNPKPKPKS